MIKTPREQFEKALRALSIELEAHKVMVRKTYAGELYGHENNILIKPPFVRFSCSEGIGWKINEALCFASRHQLTHYDWMLKNLQGQYCLTIADHRIQSNSKMPILLAPSFYNDMREDVLWIASELEEIEYSVYLRETA